MGKTSTTIHRHKNNERQLATANTCLINLCRTRSIYHQQYTFYQHKKSQILTWYKWNNINQASQIDFILANKSERWRINNVRAIRNTTLKYYTQYRTARMNIKNRWKEYFTELLNCEPQGSKTFQMKRGEY